MSSSRSQAAAGGGRLRRAPEPNAAWTPQAGLIARRRPSCLQRSPHLQGIPMPLSDRAAAWAWFVPLLPALLCATPARSAAQTPTLPSETPDTLRPATAGFDYTRREVMIPMRDGVKLHTVILVPKG